MKPSCLWKCPSQEPLVCARISCVKGVPTGQMVLRLVEASEFEKGMNLTVLLSGTNGCGKSTFFFADELLKCLEWDPKWSSSFSGFIVPRKSTFPSGLKALADYVHVNSYRSLEKNTRSEPDSVVSLAKWRILNRLHDRNETLYYKVLIDNIKDFAPIIYTPTVGLVCQNYGGLFRRPRGMYFSAKDKGEMMSMIYNWLSHQVPCKISVQSHVGHFIGKWIGHMVHIKYEH